MNQLEFLTLWTKEKPMYKAWGEFVVSAIKQSIESKGHCTSTFLKQPAKSRVKDDDSLIDKAFYRPDKEYKDPYNEIEDKVGGRFVVLLVDQINELTQIIESSIEWTYKECRHFDNERKKDPLLFTYQSVHYVLRASSDINFNGTTISKGTPCEIQLRTLLQHAYAELTHDAIYKAKRRVEPEVHRTVAKSMALIETTDDFFSDVNNKLNKGAIEDFSFINVLNEVYEKQVGVKPAAIQKSSLVVLDEFEDLIDKNLVSNLETFVNQRQFIANTIRNYSSQEPFLKQSVSIFVSWLVLKRPSRLSDDWPLDRKIIIKLATELGETLP